MPIIDDIIKQDRERLQDAWERIHDSRTPTPAHMAAARRLAIEWLISRGWRWIHTDTKSLCTNVNDLKLRTEWWIECYGPFSFEDAVITQGARESAGRLTI